MILVHDVVIWAHHGMFCYGEDFRAVAEAFKVTLPEEFLYEKEQ